jgi:hypothetical protein
MIDLVEGVAELFSESERPGVAEFGEVNFTNETARELTYEAAWYLAASNVPAERWPCPHCGAVVELKEGSKHPVHMGKRQEVLPPCKAIWRSRESQ